MKHIKRINEYNGSGRQIDPNNEIDSSGLFHWNSLLDDDIKLKMLKWYNNLSEEEKQYIEDFRREAAMDEYDSHCGEEL